MKWLGIIILATLSVFEVSAQDVTFEVAAPTAVEAGELFRIEFIVNGARGAQFSPPAIEGFEVMAGPSESTGVSVQVVNGRSSRTETTTWTYVLQGFEPGVHTVSAASATVGGTTYRTRTVNIEVVAGSSGTSGTGSGADSAGEAAVGAYDIFVRAMVSRSEVYKGEPVAVSLKLYSRVRFGLDNLTPPALNGFWQQDISPQQVTEQRETVDGRVYNSYVLKQYLLYPQQAGGLTVEPFDATVSVLIQSSQGSPRNIFDELMGGAGAQQVQREIASEPVRVTVKEWPAGAPASFDGAVGQFEITSVPPPAVVGANSSASYVMRLEGTGNFPLVRTPTLELPASFEQYNVTTADNTRHTATGTSGFREFTYPFIPRTDGVYIIPAPEFTFFDPRSKQYVTLSSREISLEVTADSSATALSGGVAGGLGREDLQIFGQDIRFIKRGSAGLHRSDRTFMWSWEWVTVAAVLIVGAAAGYVFGGRRLRNMQSDRFVRSKHANKVALRRLRIAEASMKRGNRNAFYDEMLKGLWGYMSDKLDIPLSQLSKDRLREELFERSVPDDDARDFANVISECEAAQYSPSASTQMEELYAKGVDLISRLEL